MPDPVDCERHTRPRSTSDDLSLSPPQAKRLKVDKDADSSQSSSTSDECFTLVDLPDDVLIHVFSFLNPIDLVHLAECCRRLAEVCQYKTLWEIVDSSNSSLSPQSMYRIIRLVKSNTKTIKLKGNVWNRSQVTFSKKMVKLMASNAPFLKTLIMDNHLFDACDVVLEDFPETLEHLAIRNTFISNLPTAVSYMYRIHNQLSRLKILDLTNSPWFSPHCLLAISKIPTLEELILNGCNVTDFMPYASLASKFGFKSLKSLDLRNTAIGDSDVTCFCEKESLRRLYLSATPLSACLRDTIMITDRSITTFGARRLTVFEVVLPYRDRLLRDAPDESESSCRLETLVLHNYPEVTDASLRHLSKCIKTLKFLDVTSCGCTSEGLDRFRASRPDVRLLPETAT